MQKTSDFTLVLYGPGQAFRRECLFLRASSYTIKSRLGTLRFSILVETGGLRAADVDEVPCADE